VTLSPGAAVASLDPVTACPRCQTPLAADVLEGLCPRCALEQALEAAEPSFEPELKAPFEGYQLIRRIADGGMGVVFEARATGQDRVVALKLLKGGAMASEQEQQRFRDEAREAAALHHPNIVPIHDTGDGAEWPYFTMPLMSGGTLHDHLPALRRDRARACSIVATVARAIHYGHQRGILHRDLKPTNVLLDAHGTPFVADFGTAKRLASSSGFTRTGAAVGTPGYMSPEQARGDASLTVAADVYGLGAILYELVTGAPPFPSEPFEAACLAVISKEPTRPRTMVPELHRDLETICLKCLEKEPSQRYASAEQLAEDIEAYFRGEPLPHARPVGPLGRLWRSVLRHPVATGVMTGLVLAAASTAWLANRQEGKLRADVLAANAHAARLAAGAVQFQLSNFSREVELASRDAALIPVLERADQGELASLPMPAGLTPPGPGSFVDSWLYTDASGATRSRWPHPEGYEFGKRFDFRDYFKRGMKGLHISKAFVSESNGSLKFAITAPVRTNDGRALGVMGAHFVAADFMGGLHPHDAARNVAVVAPMDGSRAGPPEHAWVFLLHKDLKAGQQVPFDPTRVPGFESLATGSPERTLMVDDYRDPFPGFGGRWLAGLAPVGATGFVVIVQTPYDPAEPVQNVLLLFVLPAVVGALVALGTHLARRRRVR
jgi:eukaryotic-like serine/threonine-protein kinase